MLDELIWHRKYRPKTLDDCIFPDHLYDTFAGWIEKGHVPDVVFYGSPGIGKTTIAKVLVETIGSEWFKINGSLDGNKDTLRTDIFQFASTVSLTDAGKKYVLIDEADGTTYDAQKALRGFIDEYGKNCGFIFTANFENKILEPIHSRVQMISFAIPKEERPALMEKTFKAMVKILKAEGVAYDAKVLSQIVVDNFPDIRRTINELQRIANQDGAINRVYGGLVEAEIENIFGWLSARDFPALRKWCAETSVEFHTLAKVMFDRSYDFVKNDSVASLVILLGEYQHKAALVVDQEINMAAFLAQAMNEVEYKV